MNIVLISTYELGHQPFGLASPAAWLKQAGATVTCLDLAVQRLDEATIASADLIAFYVPMHTATRVAASFVRRVKAINPRAHVCFYGLYAPVNEGYLRELGADTILGGEFEEGLVALHKRLDMAGANAQQSRQPEPRISLARQRFLTPERSGLPALSQYAYLNLGEGVRRAVGYTEASRGCKHVCRHCPIVPVYGGQFRVVQRDIALEDIRQQVAAGARHITFGDPDFFNGPGHALRLVEELHRTFPNVTYDVTIKIEHLLQHARRLPVLRDTGCLFVTSAVEAVDDHILEIFDKRHTRQDFIQVASLFREIGLTLNPTFVPFTPWTSLDGYVALLALIAKLDLIENVAPIQYAIRLLVPAGSKLLELAVVQEWVGEFDAAALCHAWIHPDARVDRLHAAVLAAVKDGQARNQPRRELFSTVWRLAQQAAGHVPVRPPPFSGAFPNAPIPHLSEPWYC
jgi:radical SAM superfamily enzyme YgiQ (UPF0313 family)